MSKSGRFGGSAAKVCVAVGSGMLSVEFTLFSGVLDGGGDTVTVGSGLAFWGMFVPRRGVPVLIKRSAGWLIRQAPIPTAVNKTKNKVLR